MVDTSERSPRPLKVIPPQVKSPTPVQRYAVSVLNWIDAKNAPRTTLPVIALTTPVVRSRDIIWPLCTGTTSCTDGSGRCCTAYRSLLAGTYLGRRG